MDLERVLSFYINGRFYNKEFQTKRNYLWTLSFFLFNYKLFKFFIKRRFQEKGQISQESNTYGEAKSFILFSA